MYRTGRRISTYLEHATEGRRAKSNHGDFEPCSSQTASIDCHRSVAAVLSSLRRGQVLGFGSARCERTNPDDVTDVFLAVQQFDTGYLQQHEVSRCSVLLWASYITSNS